MANIINWGQAHLPNNSDFGEGADNTIGYANIYSTSESGETWLGYTIAYQFNTRVLADGGTVESLKCIRL